MNSVPRMRTISTAFAELRAIDNDTSITESGLRRLVREGKVPSVRVGRKILLNVDILIQFLSNDEVQQKDPEQEYTGIRRIGE